MLSLYLSLGSNMGDRQKNLDSAVALLDSYLHKKHSLLSKTIQTESWGFDAPDFLNTAILYELDWKVSERNASRILGICKRIEQQLGRSGKPEYDASGNRVYHSRPIDIDILFVSALQMHSKRLLIPHPLIAERDFVLIPLREIAKPELKESFPQYF